MELTPCWRYTLGWLWQWLMRHATVSAQPNLRSQFKTSTQPLNFSPYGPVRAYVLIPALFHPPSPFSLSSPMFLFFSPGVILQSYAGNQIDFCACPALCNVLLIMSCCCWSGECGRGGFSCASTTYVVSPGWEMILWLIHIEDCVTGNYHPVTGNHEWQKFGACFTNTLPNEEKCKSTASFRNLHLFSRQWYKKGRMFGEEPPFLALISCC